MTAVVAAAPFSFKDFLKSFMLVELLKGMVLTGGAFRQGHGSSSKKDAFVAAVPWSSAGCR